MVKAVIKRNDKVGRVRQYWYKVTVKHPTFSLTSIIYDLTKHNADRRFRRTNKLFRKHVRAIGASPLTFPITVTRINRSDI